MLPKIRYITPEYVQSISKNYLNKKPYTDVIRARKVDMWWIMQQLDEMSRSSRILEFGAWPTDAWVIANHRWEDLLVTDSFSWLYDRDIHADMSRDQWEVQLDLFDIRHCQLDVQDMMQSEPFNAIYSISVLEHVIDDEKGLKNIFNALVPGGLFAFTTEMNPYVGMKYDKDIFFRVYTPEELVLKLTAAGFEVNSDSEPYDDFDKEFKVAIDTPSLLRLPYKHFLSAGVVARKPR